MNVKLKALINTVLFVLYIAAVAVTTHVVINLFGSTGFYTLMGLFAAAGLYIVYSINVARLEFRANRKEAK